MAVFIQRTHNPCGTNLGNEPFVVRPFTSSCIKTGTRRIMPLDELSPVVRLGRQTSLDSSARRIIRLCARLYTLRTDALQMFGSCSSFQRDYASLV